MAVVEVARQNGYPVIKKLLHRSTIDIRYSVEYQTKSLVSFVWLFKYSRVFVCRIVFLVGCLSALLLTHFATLRSNLVNNWTNTTIIITKFDYSLIVTKPDCYYYFSSMIESQIWGVIGCVLRNCNLQETEMLYHYYHYGEIFTLKKVLFVNAREKEKRKNKTEFFTWCWYYRYRSGLMLIL